MVIRRKKNIIESTIPITKMRRTGIPSPLQDRIEKEILKGNDTISKLYKVIPDHDPAHIRKAIRKMVEGHRIKQKFFI